MHTARDSRHKISAEMTNYTLQQNEGEKGKIYLQSHTVKDVGLCYGLCVLIRVLVGGYECIS